MIALHAGTMVRVRFSGCIAFPKEQCVIVGFNRTKLGVAGKWRFSEPGRGFYFAHYCAENPLVETRRTLQIHHMLKEQTFNAFVLLSHSKLCAPTAKQKGKGRTSERADQFGKHLGNKSDRSSINKLKFVPSQSPECALLLLFFIDCQQRQPGK